MAFHFRLQKMLSLSVMKETMKKMELASENRKLSVLGARKSELQGDVLSVLSHKSGLDMRWALYYAERIRCDLSDLEGLEKELAAQSREVQLRREELQVVSNKKRALEALRQSRLGEYKTLAVRKDQKDSDETFRLYQGVKNFNRQHRS